MIALIQRVVSARACLAGQTIGTIGPGILAFVAVERGDGDAQPRRLWERVCGYRIFPDQAGRMNLSVDETGGEVLLISQFTLAADTDKGMRPSFSRAAAPEVGRCLFEHFVDLARQTLPGRVACGRFGADMQVHLINDGPVTFWLQVPPG